MSCNGCRVLRKGCSESCILRSCLQWIESPEAQGHATVFVAKFFGRAGLMAFLSSVPEENRPALFQSLLFESCGRSINPVSGAVGLMWTRKWNLCLEAVETVLRGGTIRPISELPEVRAADDEEVNGMWPKSPLIGNLLSHVKCDLELYLRLPVTEEKEMPGTPSMNSSTTGDENNCIDREQRVLNLFV